MSNDDQPRPRRPRPFSPNEFEPFAGGTDPARVSEAAHMAAQALVHHGRSSDDPEVTERLVRLADEQGLEAIAEMWSESPSRSLPGALWRLYALRAAIQKEPERMAAYFKAGQEQQDVSKVVAGVAQPPGSEEVATMADAVLSGAFDGDFDVALERFAAFCRIVAVGQVHHADSVEVSNEAFATKLTRNSNQLVRTAEDLEAAAAAWRRDELD